MVIGEGLPFIKGYITCINAAIKQQDPSKSLSRLQQYWLSFVILGVLVTNTLCWERFERYGLGNYSKAAFEGWNELSKQRGIEGADRGVTLSLLCDHALLLHQEQQALFKDKGSAITVGCIREKVMMESFTKFIKGIVMSDNPKTLFEEYSDKICEFFNTLPSIKHLRHVNMDFLPAELETKTEENNLKI